MCETCNRQEAERAYKALRLNGYNYPIYNSRLLAASVRKPTLWIKRAGHSHSPYNIKLKAASIMRCPEELRKERERADNALSINCGF